MNVTGFDGITQQSTRVHSENAHANDPRIAFFDHHAPTWDDDPDEIARVLKRLAELRELVGLLPGQSVLEVGCGTGRVTGWIAETVRPGRVVAVDFSPAMLAQAQGRGVETDFRLVDICEPAVFHQQFDVAFCFHVFPHFRHPFDALRNIRQLLKPAGRLIVLHLAGSEQLNAFHSQLPHPVCHDRMPTREIWLELLTRAGLRLLSVTDEPDLFLLIAVPAADD